MDIKEEYLKFNVGSVNELIKQKLEPQFPDVAYKGSSANIMAETISSVFSMLVYQLNRTASNSTFSKTDSLTSLIEQTKLLGYNPVGYQSSSMFVNIFPTNGFDIRSYTIPRYSYINTTLGKFSTTEDLEFSYSGSPDIALLDDIVLKGGQWVEYPLLVGDGAPNQRITITNDIGKLIDHNSINVYIKDTDNNGKWEEWNQVDSLFLSSGFDKDFEARLNTTGTYDLTFGDGVNGCYIPDGASIAIYYMSIITPDIDETISSNTVSENLVRFSTDRINEILLDIVDVDKTYVLGVTSGAFFVENTSASTAYSEPEDLIDIRRNAPVAFQTQNRLVTAEDYRSFVINNFSDFISDVVVLSNSEFVDGYMQYYYEQGLENPLLESRALYNQIEYADACNFNNVYVFLIPKSGNYVSDIQKKLIIDSIEKTKTLTTSVVPSDPIYINFGIATPTTAITEGDLNTSTLQITKSSNSNRSDDDIRTTVYNTIVNYFDERSALFSNTVDTVDTYELNALLLNISGVQAVHTLNDNISNTGLQLYQFNPQFPSKVYTTPPNILFSEIFVPRLYDNNLLNKITILQSNGNN
jgi:hypothetical protein